MIGIPIGWAYGHVMEWALHKGLHRFGKKREQRFSFHFHDHHAASRRDGFHDRMYEDSVLQWNAAGKEAVYLGLTLAAHLPLATVAPFFTATVVASGVQYYLVHKRSHLDPDWAREHVPWHYDHHMGANQHANWGVRSDWVDRVMGTREPYIGTEREARDNARRAAREAAREETREGAA
ncbi:MAG: hypothetical protein H6739_24095 [Alphaproteobacteria bacterium]|nr:hypothetical protein [Alphaproteobacteria bacterium]